MKNSEILHYSSLPDIITVNQMRKFLNIGSNTAYRLLGEQKIRSVRIGTKHRIPKSELIRFINEQETK